jgi:hypothetical protein
VTILFVISDVKTNCKGLCPLYCRLTLNKGRKQFSTGLIVNPNYWKNKLQKVSIENTNHQLLNAQEHIKAQYKIELSAKLSPC